MEEYYSFVFFLLIFLQDHLKGFLSTIVCFLMVKLNTIGAAYLQMLGCSYYEAYMFYEAIVFAVSIFLLGCRLGVILCIVSAISFFVNAVGAFMYDTDFYQWYYQSYSIINIAMFELLVWVCLINSRLNPYIRNPKKIIRRLKHVDNSKRFGN